jgi:hypothetical protein
MEFDWGVFEVFLVTDFSYTCKTICMEVSKYLPFVNAENNCFFLNAKNVFRSKLLENKFCIYIVFVDLNVEPVYGDMSFLLVFKKRGVAF